MTFFFGPNIIGTQTTSPAPKIVPWAGYTVDYDFDLLTPLDQTKNDLAGTTVNGAAASTSAASVTEGNYAWAAFQFVSPSGSGGIQLMDAVKMGFAVTGASPSDYVNNNQLFVFTLNQNGTIKELIKAPSNTSVTVNSILAGPVTLGGTNSVYGSGANAYTTTTTTASASYSDLNTNNITIKDSTPNPVNLGTDVYGVLLVTAVKEDTLVENGDRVLFQVTTNDTTKFTDSTYVEQYVDIVDKYTAATLPEVVVSNHSGWASFITAPTSYSTNLFSTGEGNQGIGTKIVEPTPTASVQEGQWAYATFDIVKPGTAPGILNESPLQFDTNIRASFSGASPSDYQGNFVVHAWKDADGQSGPVAGSYYIPTKNSDGTYKLLKDTTHIAMAVRTAKDDLVESGEEVLFQFGKVDVNAFTASDYLEKKVKIVDTINTWKLDTGSSWVQQANVQDNFIIKHGDTYLSNGTTDKYKTIFGLDKGDFLSVDIAPFADNGNPGLHLANWGKLTINEGALVQGLRMLDGVECAAGGVYVMEVAGATDTFVIIDSDNNGKLYMNRETVGTDFVGDIVVKLSGVAASLIQSTDFVLS